jgi:phosphomannomutase
MGAPLMLSVSGARGIVDESMTPTVARQFAAAYGSVVRQRHGDERVTMCIGRDGRPSGESLSSAVTDGLTAVGCDVVDLGIAATPTVGVMIARDAAAGGMVITASHNPQEWNGLKCLNGDGVAPPPEEAAQIIHRFEAAEAEFVHHEQVGRHTRDDSATKVHVQRVLDAIDPDPVRDCAFTVALDSVNGAGGFGGRMLLEQLGCRVVHLNDEPTGRFTHPPEPAAAHLEQLAAETAANNAVIGFAQDPDADRLAILDETGAYIGEEYTLVLATLCVLDKGIAGDLATNLSTSRMIDDLASGRGRSVLRTAVGEANVVATMQARGCAAGGEGNGGVIYPPVCWVRDSFSGMALVLSLLAADQRPLSKIVGDLPRYAMLKSKIELTALGTGAGLDDALRRLREHFASAMINNVDGVRVDLADGWLHVRPSNTEPIVRVITEARTESRATELMETARAIFDGTQSGR